MEESGINGRYCWKDSSFWITGTVTCIPVIGLFGIFFYGSYFGLGSTL